MRSSGSSASPMADRVLGSVQRHRPSPDEHPSAVRAVRAGQDAGQLGAARAHQPGHADDLAPPQREADVAQHARPRQALRAQDLLSRRRPPPGEVVAQLPARHQLHQLRHRDLADAAGGHVAPVAQHGHAMADARDLLHAVGDVDDGHAPSGEPLDGGEELRDLAGGQRGGRLVHDDEPGLALQRLRHLHHLLARHAQLLHRRARVDHDAQALQPLARLAVLRAAVDEAQPPRLAPQRDVLGHREVRDQVQLLVDDADAAPVRIARAGDLHQLAVQPDLARVPGLGAAQDLHERRLAGAVLAQQDVHLARAHLQVHPVQRDHAGEALADALHLQGGRGVSGWWGSQGPLRAAGVRTSGWSPPSRACRSARRRGRARASRRTGCPSSRRRSSRPWARGWPR